MSYASQETSAFDGFPIELWLFTRMSQAWRYCSNDDDKIIAGLPYRSAQIKRPALEQNQDMARMPLNLTMDKDLDVLRQFRGSPPTDVVRVSLLRYHEGDGILTTPWTGRVVNVKFREREAEVRCEPVYTSLRRPALRRMYQTACPHVLYGKQCGVLASLFQVDATLNAVSGRDLSSAAFAAKPDGYFAGGYVDWESGGLLERRFITAHVGGAITVNLPFRGIPSNAVVRAFPGCDHTLATCAEKFDNELNYGGQPFYPRKNPMVGVSIY